MVRDLKDKLLKSEVNACAKRGKGKMVNSAMSTKCGKWVYDSSSSYSVFI